MVSSKSLTGMFQYIFVMLKKRILRFIKWNFKEILHEMNCTLYIKIYGI